MRKFLLLVALMAIANQANAQTTRKLGWSFTGQVTAVWTGGNSEARTFGMNTTVRRVTQPGELKFEVGGIRTDATRKTRRAIGTTDIFEITEEEHVERTAERYYGRARYDRNTSATAVVFVGLDVMRNTFAGIDHRTLLAAGAGNVWANTERTKFKTDYGITYTFQRDVVENPFLKSSFPGARVSGELRHTLTTTSRFESAFISDLGFSDLDDLRFDWTNSVTVSINTVLSLKPSLQVQWRNQPALVAVPLYSSDGLLTNQKVSVPLEKLDEFFTLGLVVKL